VGTKPGFSRPEIRGLQAGGRSVLGDPVHPQAHAQLVEIDVAGFNDGLAQLDLAVALLFPALVLSVPEE
jgi:hypothetical protein